MAEAAHDASHASAQLADPDAANPVKELRLALVCYGGVSLAIYMHGLTQELHRLAIASARERSVQPGSTQEIYRDLLDELEARSDARTRVVIDIISGTSAGGINGVSLARALAQGGVLDPVRDLWMEHADIRKLVRGEWGRMIQRIWPAIEDNWPRIEQHFPKLAKLNIPGVEIHRHGPIARLRHIVSIALHGRQDVTHVARTPSALHGDALSSLLADGLRRITAGESSGTLMPPGHRLDLFVTMTDLNGYVQHVPLGDEYVSEHAYRHVNRFSHYDPRDEADAASPSRDFTDEFVDMLAFSGRASSSFPGAFEPVGLDLFATDIARGNPPRTVTWQREQVLRFFRRYALHWAETANQPELDPDAAAADIARRTFVDGGVLDNYPFDHAITAIRARPADHETRRVLIYLEPDPMRRPEDEREVAAAGDSIVSMFSAVKAAAKDIPLEQPILAQIQSLEQMNDAARRLHEIIAAAAPRKRRVESVARSMEPENIAYLAFRVDSVSRGLATSICRLRGFPEDSNQAVATREVVDKWVDAKVRFTVSPDGELNAAVGDFLGGFDFGYQRRRLRFLVDGVISLYPSKAARDANPLELPTRPQLDAAKKLLYAGIAQIDRAYDVVARDAGILESVRTLFPDSISNRVMGRPDSSRGKIKNAAITATLGEDDEFGTLVESVRHRLGTALPDDLSERTFEAHARAVFEQLVRMVRGEEPDESAGWPDAAWHEDRFRSRFQLFEQWDRVVYPIQRAFGVGEHDIVGLARMSPLDAHLLAPDDDDREARNSFYEDKLKGVQFGHFGAFLEPSWRQSDYLWGRLDAAERLVRLLVNDEAQTEIFELFSYRLFDAILREEEPHLPQAAETIAYVRERIPVA